MRSLVLMAIILIGSLKLSAQVVISGRVVDNKKQPVAGVSISIKDSYDGATTDSTGKFRFSTTEKGERLLQFSSIGYRPYEQTIKIESSPIVLEIALKEEVNEMNAVVITAGTFEASDRKKTTVLNPIDIVTTASGNGDVTGALKTLPGAQQVGESEGLFVRGGTAAETKTFIDGTLVNNFFYSSVPNIAQRGRFSPFIFKGTVFSTGGYSALYGQALSSALILESIDLPEQSSANLGISVIGASGGYQHLAKNKKSSWGMNYGYTNLWLAFKLIKQRQQYQQVPEYHAGDANFRIKTSKTGIIKYYGYFSSNRLSFFTPSIDTIGYKDGFGIKNFNIYHNLTYRENVGRKLKLNAGVSYTNNHDDIRSSLYDDSKQEVLVTGLEFKDFKLDSKGNYFNAKVVLERRLRGLSMIRFGGEYNFTGDKAVYTTYNNQQYPNKVKEHIKSLFAETDIYVTNDLAAKLGTRYEHSSLFNQSNFAPRVSLAYKTGKQSQASVAYGIFYQNPERRYLPSSSSLTFSKATHYIAQYQKVSNLITFRAEVFYKKYEDLIKTTSANGQEQATSNNGYGDAKGIEFFWRDKKTFKNLDYWISYSYLDTKRDFLNFPAAIQPNFAAKHTASVVMKKFVTKWKTGFNMAYNYNSGRPYYFIGPDGSGNTKFYDRGETPDYHNVSFSLNYLPSLGKQGARQFTVIVVSVSNVLGLNQVYGYQYSYNGFRKEAIVPPSKTFVFVGAFISFGIDRTEDAINNNL
ncbi:MAG: TonB-dependent receptor [Chitinophagaceae bacterium]|nr:TonB-dependent receptor [Chitinophagaceae bacterium]